jgi:hypothetical protein
MTASLAPTSMPSAFARLRSSTIPSSRSCEPAVSTGMFTAVRLLRPARSTRSVLPRGPTVARTSGTGAPLSVTPGSSASARASACEGTKASTCAPLAAVNVRPQGSSPLERTSRASTIVAAAAPAIAIVSTLASSRERMPANASLNSSTVTPGLAARAAERPGGRQPAGSRRQPDRRGA